MRYDSTLFLTRSGPPRMPSIRLVQSWLWGSLFHRLLRCGRIEDEVAVVWYQAFGRLAIKGHYCSPRVGVRPGKAQADRLADLRGSRSACCGSGFYMKVFSVIFVIVQLELDAPGDELPHRLERQPPRRERVRALNFSGGPAHRVTAGSISAAATPVRE
jgi:hypothetical protein